MLQLMLFRSIVFRNCHSLIHGYGKFKWRSGSGRRATRVEWSVSWPNDFLGSHGRRHDCLTDRLTVRDPLLLLAALSESWNGPSLMFSEKAIVLFCIECRSLCLFLDQGIRHC